jgi:hypothetical protein
MHAHLLYVAAAHFDELDKLEYVYKRVAVQVRTYDDRLISAWAYQWDEAKLSLSPPHALPSERYVDIIAQGCEHYGVDAEHVRWLRSLPHEPRKRVDEYRKIPSPPDREISEAELAANNGKHGAALWISINGKVLMFAEDPADNKDAQVQWDLHSARYGGQDATFFLSCVIYEPRYAVPTDYASMSSDLRGWAEELFCGWVLTAGKCQLPGEPTEYDFGRWRVIGWVAGHRTKL